MAGVEALLGRLIGEHITLLAVAGSGVGSVRIDPTQLEMVIMNLAVNARDAMPDGGRLTIETRGVNLAPGQVPSLEPGAYVEISVADTGQGMDEATAARIFEPFFTTKPLGKGTGLGLSAAHGIVQHSEGALTMESAPGQGTTFHVYLPVAATAAAESEATVPLPLDAPSTQTTGSVLVVEDHPPLRDLIATVLSDAGYRVLEAANGAEAIRIARQSSVDVVVLMSGHDRGLLKDYADGALFLQNRSRPER